METTALITAIITLGSVVAFLYRENTRLNTIIYQQQESKLKMQEKHSDELKAMHKETLEQVRQMLPGGAHA